MNEQVQDWETLIASRMRPCVALKTEDAAKRNSEMATKRWRKNHMEHYLSKQKEWREANPEKVSLYQKRNMKNVKRWAEEHHERVLELNRKHDRKRAKSPERIAYKKAYNSRPDVKARRAEYYRLRSQTPERKEYERLRSRRRRLAKFNAGFPSVMSLTLQDAGIITVHLFKEFR